MRRSLRESERSTNTDTTILNGQASRYGYANFLKEHRNFGVLHRIWPGTERMLLSGRPGLCGRLQSRLQFLREHGRGVE